MKFIFSKSAISTIEYLLFLAVTLGIIFAFMAKGGPYEKSLYNVINGQADSVINTGKALFF